jgi:3'-phosphoadenosine 5'-phosphosulfate sulfotransferase (PAPS reductase)/FAD synthetase
MTAPKHEVEAYRLHAGLPVYQRRVAEAQRWVQRAIEDHPGPWCVGVSGGKDSAVAVEIAVEAGWRGDVFHFIYRETPEENTRLAKASADRHGLPFKSVLVAGAFDVYDRLGRFFPYPVSDDEKRAVAWMNREYKRQAEAFSQEQGWTGQIWGMRAEESRRRARVLGARGPIYQTKARQTVTCCPLWNWSGRDIWAYLFERGIPYLSCYDRNEDGRERGRSEMTWLAEPWVWLMDGGGKLRRENPGAWSLLCKTYPELRDYT